MEWWDCFWVVCWQLWVARNAWIFDARMVQFKEVVEKCMRSVLEFKRENEDRNITSLRCISSSRWSAPPLCSFKLNTDTAMSKDGLIGLGEWCVIMREMC